MKLAKLTPMLWVKDVSATIDYYSNVLGFAKAGMLENGGWGSVVRDNVELMFTSFFEAKAKGEQFPGTFYLYTNDIDAWWEHLKEKAEVFYPIENFEYGMREFAIKDCNGFIIQFGKEIA